MAIVNIGGKIFLSKSVANLDYKYGPYTSKAEAFTALGPDGEDVLAVGLTVGIQPTESDPIKEYWFRDACDTVNDLVEKSLTDDSETIIEIKEDIEELEEEIDSLTIDGGDVE